jgi:hypothetical protein
MIRNPFARKPKTPIEQALDRFDEVRRDAAVYAATIRGAVADVANTLTALAPPARKGSKLPVIAVVAASGIGLAYMVRSKVSGSAPQQYPQPETPKEPEIVVRNGQPEPPLTPTPAEETKEIRVATAESEAAAESK